MEEKFWQYWGKAGKDEGPEAQYHLLVYHCLDVAAVGDVLLRCRGDISDMFSGVLDMPPDVFRPWAVFFLSLHDIGKFSEAFQGLRQDIYRQFHGKESEKRYTQRHDSLGYAVWKKYLWKSIKKEGGLGFASASEWAGSKVFDLWMQVVTGHHGKPPKEERYIENFFSKDDMEACRAFIREMGEMLLPEAEKSEPFFKDKSLVKKFRPLSWSLAGFSVLCDWIGSDSSRFPFQKEKIPLKEYWQSALSKAEQAVAQYGILPPVRSSYVSVQHLFDYVSDPTPLQDYCHRREIGPEPQLWILEDVTGSGKTEAALTLAHRLMSLRGETGIYIGLPTMATANAMYERMGKCYRKLYADESRPSLCLAHSARHLSDLFRDSVLAEHSGEMRYTKEEKSASAHCNAWLADHRKKALLADVGIGTVDQALLGILPVRHQSLRLLGLVSKILIIDEIHAFDDYTGRLIQALLKYQAMNGGSAILLSATLPREMRYEMVKAFREGLGIEEEEAELKSCEYPLVTMVNAKEIREHSVDTREEVKRKVEVKLLHKEEDVYDLIPGSAASGHCVCWIRNTVSDAMSAFEQIAEMRPDAERLLFHSRFTLSDRLGIERKVLDSFGEKSASEQRAGKILVATQVVEQSLDLDFDLLISDLAPMDLLIQRAGRLHRHIRDEKGNRKRGKGEKEERPSPVFYVYGPEPVPDPGEKWFRSFFPKGCFVYPHTGHLWRTVRLLAEYGAIRMPGDARELIEGVFDEEKGEPFPETLEEPSFTVDGKKMGERDMAEYNSLKIGKGYSSDNSQWYEDSRFPTRLGENTVTLYVARYQEGKLRPWASGEFPWDLSSLKVYESDLSDISPDTSADLKKKLAQLKEKEKGLSEESFVLPLLQTGEEWEGEGISKKGKRVKVRYSAERGCLIEQI